MSLLEHEGGVVPAMRLLTPRSIGSGVLVAVASPRSDRLQSRVARRVGPNGAYEEIPDA
ncbi:MAG: hypothetical protein OXQ28_12800 [Acidobacteriota bacterium]|nr:hypothetical protein [Acidobacteriota bacterium]